MKSRDRSKGRDRAKRLRTTAILLHAACLLAPCALHAQDDAPELLTAVPETPALALLDATTSRVLRPGSVRDFALALLSGTGESGTAQHGFAVEATPWLLVPGVAIDGRSYMDSRLAFILANAQLSIGTARSEGDEADTDLALGFRLTLADRGDPLRSGEFRRALAVALLECAPAQPDPTPSDACVSRETEAAWEAWTADRWNAARLAVAAAWGVRLEASELDEREYAGWGAWAVGAFPLGRRGQLIAQVAREDRPDLAPLPGFTEWSAGARALVGSAKINGFLEYVALSRELDGQDVPDGAEPPDLERDAGLWSAGVEARVAEGLWASAGFGTRLSELLGDAEKTFVVLGLRWGISSTARMDALRNANPQVATVVRVRDVTQRTDASSRLRYSKRVQALAREPARRSRPYNSRTPRSSTDAFDPLQHPKECGGAGHEASAELMAIPLARAVPHRARGEGGRSEGLLPAGGRAWSGAGCALFTPPGSPGRAPATGGFVRGRRRIRGPAARGRRRFPPADPG